MKLKCQCLYLMSHFVIHVLSTSTYSLLGVYYMVFHSSKHNAYLGPCVYATIFMSESDSLFLTIPWAWCAYKWFQTGLMIAFPLVAFYLRFKLIKIYFMSSCFSHLWLKTYKKLSASVWQPCIIFNNWLSLAKSFLWIDEVG